MKETNNKTKQIISPLFTLFIYRRSPEKYSELQNKYREKLIKMWNYDSVYKEFYENNRPMAERNITDCMEFRYPLYYYNDMAGFIVIGIENAAEGIRIVADIILRKKVNKKVIFTYKSGTRKIMRRKLLIRPGRFNKKFYETVEKIIDEIKTDILQNKYYIIMDRNRLNWEFIKTANVAKFIKELGSDWIY